MTRRIVRYSPLPSQLAFHRQLERFKGFSGPVGSGKSAALCAEAIRAAYANPGRTGLIGAPSLAMLRDSTCTALLQILAAAEVPHTYTRSDSCIVLTEPGARILLRSLDDYERLRGPNLAWFGVDELTYCQEEAWTRLEARLRDPEARTLSGFAAWTPKGFDWVHRRFIASPVTASPVTASRPLGSGCPIEGYGLTLAEPFENPHLAPGYYESLKRSYAAAFYEQEVKGAYLNVTSGRAYAAFDRAAHIAPQRYVPEVPLLWSLDFNVDPMSAVVCQRDAAGVLRVLDEIVMRRVTTIDACMEFIRRYPRATHVTIFGDASGARMQTSGASDYEMLRRTLRQRSTAAARFQVPASNPPVRDRLAAVNAALRNAAGEIGIRIDPRCRELIADLEECKLLNGEEAHRAEGSVVRGSIIDKRDARRTHVSDALGYLIWQQRPIERPGERPAA